jgi:hypothetical protein
MPLHSSTSFGACRRADVRRTAARGHILFSTPKQMIVRCVMPRFLSLSIFKYICECTSLPFTSVLSSYMCAWRAGPPGATSSPRPVRRERASGGAGGRKRQAVEEQEQVAQEEMLRTMAKLTLANSQQIRALQGCLFITYLAPVDSGIVKEPKIALPQLQQPAAAVPAVWSLWTRLRSNVTPLPSARPLGARPRTPL